jgi:hypothetical protein
MESSTLNTEKVRLKRIAETIRSIKAGTANRGAK